MKPIIVLIKVSFLFLVITFFISCHLSADGVPSASHEGKMFVKTVAFKTATGWGYAIYVDDSLYIRQAIIPGLPGKHSFANREDALKTGKMVIDKMAAAHSMPFVSQNDLRQLHIQLPD